ncbi:hypothetical protein FBU30_007130 [Linnemannia zychae]|nr:hypothetical protein FBU30_007130 [Linnemannia zychae]
MVRRRHRRKNNRPRDPEMVEHRNNSTYRPESGDEVSPPQYRAYMLDQPYHDPEMAYPDSVHYGAEQGMIQHLAVLEQQERCQQQTAGATEVLLDQDNQDVADNVERPMLTTTTTTTTLTTTTTTTITQPAPAHAQTFFTGRHLSILRLGLSNYHHNHSRSSSSNSSSSQSTSSSSSSGSRSSPRPARQMWTNPATYSESYMVIGHEISTNSNNTNHYTTSATTSCSSSSNMPALYRLRSMGPPPYIPPSDDEEAPALPPSYNVAVEVPVHTTPIVSSEIAAH